MKNFRDTLLTSLISIPIGICVGILCFIFTKILNIVNNLRLENPYFFMPLLPIAGLIILFIYKIFDKNDKSGLKSGMKLVFDAGQNKNNKNIPLILIPLISISTWLTILFGGSCGREGVAVQLGATLSDNFSRFNIFNNRKRAKNVLLIAGIGSGFAGMFQTPVTAIFFALEFLTVGEYKLFAIFPTIIQSFISFYTAKILGVNIQSYHIENMMQNINFLFICKIILSSIIFSMIGLLFILIIKKCKNIYNSKIKNKFLGIFVCGIIVSILFLLLHTGRYSGTGFNLIDLSFSDKAYTDIYNYDFIFKMLLTIFTLSIGFQGGEVMPLFTIGATLGVVLARLLNIDIPLIAALGYISVFASATNTFLAPIFLGCEIFGYENIIFYMLAVGISYILNFNLSIYPQNKV